MLEAHRTPECMARVLVQYIDDPERVRRVILGEFHSAPRVQTIARWREEYLRPAPAALSFKHERDAYAEAMERSNVAFVSALAGSYPELILKVA